MRKSSALLLAALLAAPAAAWAQAQQRPAATLNVTVVSSDGTTLAPSAAAPQLAPLAAIGAAAVTGIYTSEGVWTFGKPPNASGDYPLLLNGSNANGGWAGELQVTNGNLYARQKSGPYWVRWPASSAWFAAAAAPVEGTVATAITLALAVPKIPDNSPAGTLVAKATVTMSPAGATFTGPLVSTNPLYTVQGTDIVLSRAATPADDGLHTATITAVQ